MPRIVKSTEVAGQVTEEAARACGLAIGTPVCGGAFDIDACGLASGMVDETQYCIVSGTWGNHLFIAPQPVIHSDIFMCSRYAIDGWYLHLEGNPSAAGNLEWYLRNFCHHELSDGKPTAVAYLKCDALYQESEPESGLLFMPFVNGSHLCPNASGALLGIESRHQRGDVLRAVYESIAFSHRNQLERMRRFTSKIESIRLTGGMARNRALVQLLSDCFQLPISVPAGSEQGALGAAIIASVSIGDYPSLVDAASSMTRLSEQYRPRNERSRYLENKYQCYSTVVERMLTVWSTIR
jgi:L-xylulokinase